MCLRRAPEKYIAGAALDRAGLDSQLEEGVEVVSLTRRPRIQPKKFLVSSVGVQLEEINQLKNPVTSFGNEPTNFQFIA
jgi:hypothetical protein